jgi:hypothetical protein
MTVHTALAAPTAVLRWVSTRITRALTTRGWHRLRRTYLRDRSAVDGVERLRRTRVDKRIRVRQRDHLPGADRPQQLTIHDVWLERDARAWWQPRWCWWIGCGPHPRHGYRLTRRAATRALAAVLHGHGCPGGGELPAPITGTTP